jgi:hypothetical protein
MPFSRAVTYKLIDSGLISSVVVSWPGSKRGRRLIDADSLDAYLERLTAKQAAGRVELQEPESTRQGEFHRKIEQASGLIADPCPR